MNKSLFLTKPNFFQPFLDDFDKFFFDENIPSLYKDTSWDVRSIYENKLVKEEDGEYLVTEIEIPGYSKEELSITVASNRFLVVEGNRKSDNRKFKFTNLISERCDVNNIKAKCKDGILQVKIKIQPTRMIPIE